jgi:nucleotide-binding universal stress UspA family protein
MKTIAVLTDFSERSEHAAMFALHLAKKIKADVLLFNAFLVPAYTPNSTQIAWVVEDYDGIRKSTEKKLDDLRSKLVNELKEKNFPGSDLPAISYRCEEGAVANNIADIEEDKNIMLIVLATHGTDDVSAFLMGNNCRQVIDTATIPLLIVPENCAIKNIEKFVFATDIVHNDIEYISSLAGLAKQFSAEIMVINVNQNTVLSGEHEIEINLFKDRLTHNVNYSRVYYRNIPNDNVKKGLEWLIENVKFDILVMVHRKGGLFDFFFKSSITKKIADHAYVPLLVYPYPVSSIPSF